MDIVGPTITDVESEQYEYAWNNNKNKLATLYCLFNAVSPLTIVCIRRGFRPLTPVRFIIYIS